MGNKSHENSQFVVCRTCSKYFLQEDIIAHLNEHGTNEGFYYLTNSEVVFYLNRRKEIQDAVNALRLLIL